MNSFKILVCCHKQTPRIDNPIFPAILLGSNFADDDLKAAYQDCIWDNQGDNIGRLHPYCAELTSIYWAWKNYKDLGDPDYIGLFHYRRFFNFKEELPEQNLWKCAFFDFDKNTQERFGWSEESIAEFCNGYDLILPHKEQILDPHDWQTPTDLETHYKHAHCPEDFDCAVSLIKEKHPEYTEAVERARKSRFGHFCNMFVMTREMFFDYAQWLFDIILPLEELLPVSHPKYDSIAQKRVLGFLGERLFNIWIDHQRHNNKKIRQTQRLTGYLSDAEQAHFSTTYGFNEYRRILAASKPSIAPKDFDITVDEGNALLHPARTKQIPDVSILIPVYNVEPFLRECIESLIHQTLDNIEMIFVNNASTDGSLDILRVYYHADPRIAVIEHKKNEGLPGSRNTALKYARGRYFSYIDSDDICDLTMFEKLFKKAEDLDADIVTCSVTGFVDTLDNQYLHRPLEWYGNTEYALPLSQRPQQLMEPAAWCKLFRTSYVRNLDYFEFRPGTISWEDVPAMTSAFIQTDRIATVQEALYFYRQRSEGNLSNGMTRRHTNDFISGAQHQQAILDKHNFTDEGVMSYIEEFKYLFVEWMLTKMRKRDIPYLFHRAGSLFKRKNRRHLDRLFLYYPQRRFVYFTIKTRSCLLYYSGRLCYRIAKKTKNLLKRLLDVQRDGCYRTFRIGPFRCRQFLKKYSNETISWLEGRYHESQAAIGQLSTRNADLQNKQLTLESENRSLGEQVANAQACISTLECEKESLLHNNNTLKQENAALTSANSALVQSNSQLTETNDSLVQSNSQLTETNDSLVQSNLSLEKAVESLQEIRCQQSGLLSEQAKQIDSLSATVRAYQQETDGFFRAVWTTGWIEQWKQYYYDNYTKIAEKKATLKANLDRESVAVVERLCYRNFELLPKQNESSLFLYNHKKIYTPEEREGAKRPLDEAFFRQKYQIPADVHLETPVFAFDCGMKLLPEQITRQITGKVVIDGGAYWGDSALVLKEYGPSEIYAFEPQPDTFGLLRQTIQNNGLQNIVHAVQAGLGISNETRKLYTNGMLSGSSLTNVTPVHHDGEAVINDIEVVTIDEFVQQHDLDVGLIKLDIEGNELSAIQGAIETIQTHRPILSIAVYHDPKDLFEIKPLLETLNLGYRFMVRKLVYHDLVTEVVLLGYVE